MKTKQTIAIIGATGNMGSAIAKSLSKGEYRMLLMSKDAAKLDALNQEVLKTVPGADIESIGCATNASWEADIIILATPYEAESEVAEKIRQVASGKVVISISNPLTKDFNDLVTPHDTSAAEELQKLLPDSSVIKTFNTTFAADFTTPVIDGKRVDAFIAGDDQNALDAVSQVVKTAGFNPMVVGKLSFSRTLERMQLLLLQLAIRNNYNWLAGWKILHN